MDKEIDLNQGIQGKYSKLKLAHHPEKLEALKKGIISSPLYVRIKPTNVCNHSCFYCVYEGDFSGMHDTMNKIDEIPKEYEEAALVDGYSRFKAFVKVVLPQAVTGIAATAVFCLITAWNEFAFALIMTTRNARTAPPSLASRMGTSGVEWGQIAAGTFLFLLPVAVFTFIMRKHLLRGVTFGAIKK